MGRRDGVEVARKCECQLEEQYISKYQRANLPRKFIDSKIAEYYPDKNFKTQVEAKKNVQKFIDDYPAVLKGLLFQGPVGVGKTRLLCTIATELIRKRPKIDIYYIDWNDFTQEIRSNLNNQGAVMEIVNRLSHVDLLIFDELGASTLPGWLHDYMYFIFNKRYNQQKITLCATNYSDKPSDGKESLSQRVGERIRSRLFEMTEIVPVTGKDMRKEYQ